MTTISIPPAYLNAGLIGLLVLVAGLTVVRHHDTKKSHRSFIQWLIWRAYRLIFFLESVVAGFDDGYTRYCIEMREEMAPITNESKFGMLIKAKTKALPASVLMMEPREEGQFQNLVPE